MKKAIKINIRGVIFHIDEDAYEKLDGYLKTVELYFSGREGGREIVDDIESRIAELFQMRVSEQKKEVISLEDVTEVTAVMGDPSDFVEEPITQEDDHGSSSKETKRTATRGAKRLYRDPDNAVFGGVCGGLGAYFGIDPVLIRILFVVLLIAGYGVWGLVYIILWIAIPKAVSIAQKLEMRGERVTISNIEKTVKQEYEEVKSNFEKIEKSEGYKQATSTAGEILRVLGQIVVVIAKVFLILLGVILIFAGFILLMSFLGVFFFNSNFFPFEWFSISFFPLSRHLPVFADPLHLSVFLAALFVAVIIPIITIIYGGIKLIFRIRTKDRIIGILALVIWIASISVLFTLGFIEYGKYVFSGSYRENVIIAPSPSKTLYLKLEEDVNMTQLEDLTRFHSPSTGIFRSHNQPAGVSASGGFIRGHCLDPSDEMYRSCPSFSIRHIPAGDPEFVAEHRARGSS